MRERLCKCCEKVSSRYFNADHTVHARDETTSIDDVVTELGYLSQLIVDKFHE